MEKKDENEEVKDQEGTDQKETDQDDGEIVPFDEAYEHLKKEMTLQALESGLPLDEDVIVQATLTALFDLYKDEHEEVSNIEMGKLMYACYKLGMEDVHKTISTVLDYKKRELNEEDE